MAVYEKLVENDLQTLSYFAVDRGVRVRVLIGDPPHLATVGTVPSKLEVLSWSQFITVAARLLEKAEASLEAVMMCTPDLFPAGLDRKAHDLRVVQQPEFARRRGHGQSREAHLQQVKKP